MLVLFFSVGLFSFKTNSSLAGFDTLRGITNVKVSNITQTSATVTYNTNTAQQTILSCNSCGTHNEYIARTAHSFNISNLSPGTEYSFFILFANDSGSGNAEAHYFKTLLNLTRINLPTLTIADHTKPVILSINISQVATSSARINWTTDENSTSTVVLSGGSLSGSVITNAGQNSVTQHSVDLNNLNTRTAYTFTIKSKDASGNEIISSGHHFSTLNDPLELGNVSITEITSTGALIKWKTNRIATSRVMFPSGRTVENNDMVTAHNFNLTGLQPATTYRIRVESADSDLMQAYSTWFEFTTSTSGAGSAASYVNLTISNVRISNVSSTGARIAWTTNRNSNSHIDYYEKGTMNFGTADDENMVTQHALNLNNLKPDTLYSYRIESIDSDHGWAYSEMYEFQTDSAAADASSLDSTVGAGSQAADPALDQTDPFPMGGVDTSADGTGVAATADNSAGTPGLSNTSVSGNPPSNVNPKSWTEKAIALVNSGLAFVGIKGLPKFNLSLASIVSLFVAFIIILSFVIFIIIYFNVKKSKK
ncbi:MAG: fibronectin type III domain-containing protein [Candidatus Moranbacteria bacterium]|nr:fibronectin type III domain-containing protein [Candidatus Moranbacteria bacterium]